MASSSKSAIPVMIQGTHSDAGKSLIATALCRIYAEDGHRTAPFKSQNMSLNSYVTVDGKEIGRAQGVQAEAAGIVATTDMNPILIKPEGDQQSQIVVHGRPYCTMQAGEYRSNFYEQGKQIVAQSYERLARTYERIVIEGAGSPAEINLNDRELVNMHVARMADAPVILVSDIDRGGVFASLVGTLQLLNPHDRKRIIGVIINKFRGDIKLLQPGLDWFETYTGVAVLGVMPYLTHLNIEAEDSLSLRHADRYAQSASDKLIDIAVIAVSKMSNFTDLDPFTIEQDCRVRFVLSAETLGNPDLIILPGSKNVIEDMLALHENGLADAIVKRWEQGISVVGICGGYQMLGQKIEDPYGVESTHGEADGLGILPVHTVLERQKRTVRTKGMVEWEGVPIHLEGYEIHMGRTNVHGEPFMSIECDEGTRQDGCRLGNDVFGTYLHGIFHHDLFRTVFLNRIRMKKGLPIVRPNAAPSFHILRNNSIQQLADAARANLDLDKIETLLQRFINRRS